MKYSAFILPGLLVMASCSHYEAPDLSPIAEKTYTGQNLVLYYNGLPMPNKSVTIKQTGDKAEARLFADFDLSQLSAFGLSGTIPAPGVLPGEAVTTLDLTLTQADEYWDFSGKGENTYCTYSYAGYANDERMALFLQDVKLKNPGISPQVWQPAPIKSEDGIFTSLPFFIDWQYDPIPDVDLDLTPFLKALSTIPMIPVYNNTAYMSLSQAVSLMLKTLAFKDDGNMIFSYISTTGGASHLAQTLPNRFMYVVEAPGMAKLYVNPTALFGIVLIAGSTGTPSEDVEIIGNGIYPSGHVTPTSPGVMESILKSELGKKVAKAALSTLLPQLADGLPLAVYMTQEKLDLYIDTQMATQLMTAIVDPLLKDSEAVKAITEYIESNPELKPLLPQLAKAMQLLPEALERTNDFKLGLSLVPYKE